MLDFLQGQILSQCSNDALDPRSIHVAHRPNHLGVSHRAGRCVREEAPHARRRGKRGGGNAPPTIPAKRRYEIVADLLATSWTP
jgi:hypothetical protein